MSYFRVRKYVYVGGNAKVINGEVVGLAGTSVSRVAVKWQWQITLGARYRVTAHRAHL